MMTFDPGAGEPATWAVCFARKCVTAAFLPIGTYKHVRAFGVVEPINTWVFFDPAFKRTSIRLARGDAARELVREFIFDAAVIQIAARERTRRPPIFGWCTPAVAHLLGLSSGALRPDALFRQCLRQGGELLADGHTVTAARTAG
jgi:hypothetical protein